MVSHKERKTVIFIFALMLAAVVLLLSGCNQYEYKPAVDAEKVVIHWPHVWRDPDVIIENCKGNPAGCAFVYYVGDGTYLTEMYAKDFDAYGSVEHDVFCHELTHAFKGDFHPETTRRTTPIDEK